jgi:hypothetical protein
MRSAYMISWGQHSHTLTKLVSPSVKESFSNAMFFPMSKDSMHEVMWELQMQQEF